MARPLRIDIQDGLSHVTSRGWERRVVVRDDRDRQRWFELLDRVATRCGWRLFAWVLMSNHFHLDLRTPQALELTRYVHLNPVRAGLVERPEEYGWSSVAATRPGRRPSTWRDRLRTKRRA